MQKNVLRRFDLLFSILLIITSLFYIVESIKLFLNPFGRNWDTVTEETTAQILAKWYESPAIMPFIVGVLILICAMMLLIVAFKSGARIDFFRRGIFQKLKNNKELKTFIIVSATLATYIYLLIPICRNFLNVFRGFQGFPFAVATFIYIVLTTIIFSKKTKKDIIMAFVVAFIASSAITYLFNKVALIPMP